MATTRILHFILAATCALTLLASAALAQDNEAAFEEKFEGWQRQLELSELTLEAEIIAPLKLQETTSALAQIRSEATLAIEVAQARLTALQGQLATLGPAPKEGEPAEAEATAAQRTELQNALARVDSRVKRSELAIARAQQLEDRIESRERARTLGQMLQQFPLPLAPSTIAKAVPEAFGTLGLLARSPLPWWENLKLEGKSDSAIFRIIITLGLAVALGWISRRLLLRWFERDPADTEPSYARRLTGAVGQGLADGMVPAFILGGFLYRASQENTLVAGDFADLVTSFCGAMIIFVLAWAIPRAVLAPDLPAWRLLPVSPESARKLYHRITLIAAVFAFDLFFNWSTGGLPISVELESFYAFLSTSIEAVLLLTLLPRSIWHEEPGEEQQQGEEAEERSGTRIWTLVRRGAGAVAVASILATILGYAELGVYLVNNLLFSIGIAGGIMILRGLGRELVGVAARSSLLVVTLGVRHQTRHLLKVWFRIALDVAAVLIGAFVVLLLWGVPRAEVMEWARAILHGLTIGSVTISLVDIATAVLVFLVIIAVTRMLQRSLADRMLPKTRLDIGVRNSITMATGYVGIAIAAAAAVGVVGLDLSNLAIIAGALSVGIGFGLQNIVNNFVSGLILLVERPVKVGDWVVIGTNEGYIRRISVRATEIETFDRQSVIIPNSELIASSVANWTHKNRLCRIIIDVGVAYGSDTEKVRDILLECAAKDTHVIKNPAPVVIFQNFGNSSLDFQLRCFLSDVDYFLSTKSDLRFAIDKAFREQGIEIPFPQRDLHVKSVGELPKALETFDAPTPLRKTRRAARRGGLDMPDVDSADD